MRLRVLTYCSRYEAKFLLRSTIHPCDGYVPARIQSGLIVSHAVSLSYPASMAQSAARIDLVPQHLTGRNSCSVCAWFALQYAVVPL